MRRDFGPHSASIGRPPPSHVLNLCAEGSSEAAISGTCERSHGVPVGVWPKGIKISLMIRPIAKYGDGVLRARATEVTDITADVQALIDDMIETMYAAPGVGLAAPQIDVPLRIFVADPSSGRTANDLLVMINPDVVEREGVQTEPEGCLSVPGFEAPVPRPTRAVVRGLDRNGTPHSVEGIGLLARVFQHEIDHLDGSLFVDHLRGLKRDMIVRRIKKLQRSGKW